MIFPQPIDTEWSLTGVGCLGFPAMGIAATPGFVSLHPGLGYLSLSGSGSEVILYTGCIKRANIDIDWIIPIIAA